MNSGNGKFQEFASVPTTLLKIGTIWDISPDDGPFRRLYIVFRFLIRYVFVAAPIVFCLHYAMCCRNMAEFIACMCMTTTFINVAYRVSTLIRKIKSVYAFSDGLNASDFIPRNDDEEKLYQCSRKFANSVVYVFIVSIAYFSTALSVSPIFVHEYPFAFKYPFDRDAYKENNLIFYSIYAYEAISNCIYGFYGYSTDTFLFAVILFVDYQIKLLGMRISTVGHKLIAINPNDLRIDQEIIELVKMHVKIREIVNTYHVVLSSVLFFQICQSVIVLSVTVTSIIQTKIGSVDFFNQIGYLLVMLYEMGVFCFLSNKISFSSMDLPDRAYFSNFIIFNQRQRKMLQLFIHMSNARAMTLNANGFFTISLNLNTFITIVRSAYSYVLIMTSAV